MAPRTAKSRVYGLGLACVAHSLSCAACGTVCPRVTGSCSTRAPYLSRCYFMVSCGVSVRRSQARSMVSAGGHRRSTVLTLLLIRAMLQQTPMAGNTCRIEPPLWQMHLS